MATVGVKGPLYNSIPHNYVTAFIEREQGEGECRNLESLEVLRCDAFAMLYSDGLSLLVVLF